MKIINGERGSKRTTMLIHASYVTGARIVCPNFQMAKQTEQQAKDEGLDIPTPFEAWQYAEDCAHGMHRGEHILIDNAEAVIEEALKVYFHGIPVDAITINKPNVLISVISDEAREAVKKNLGEQYKEEFQG